MGEERFRQAVQLYHAGEKEKARAILKEFLSENPENVEAWYGLGICSGTDQERRYCFQHCLEIDPHFSRAQNALIKMDAGNSQESQLSSGNLQDEKIIIIHKKSNLVMNLVLVIAILSLAGAVVWQYVLMNRFEKALTATNSDLLTLESKLAKTNSELGFTISDVSSLSGRLSYVAALAENADRFAHSHPYSDIRLKTDIHQINDPLEKILKLRGVSYRWNVAGYPEMGLGKDGEIGVIAQEVEEVFPELVSVDADGYKHVDYERLTAVLIEAIKEQQNQINELKNYR